MTTAGHNPSRGTCLQSTPATGELMDELRNLYSGYRKTWLPLEMHGRQIAVRAEINVSGHTGVALADLQHMRVLPLRSPRPTPSSDPATTQRTPPPTPRAQQVGTENAPTPYPHPSGSSQV